MSAKFCHNCGKQLMVGARFCSNCGTDLSSLSATPTPAAPVQAHGQTGQTFQPFTPANDDDDDAIDRMTHLNIRMNRLDVEISRDNVQRESVASVMAQGKFLGPMTEEKRDTPYLSVDKSTFLKELHKEAGTQRDTGTPSHEIRVTVNGS